MISKLKNYRWMLWLGASAMVACDNTEEENIDIPTSYTFTREGVSSVSFSGQSTRIGMAEELVSNLTVSTQTEASLLAMYDHAGGDNDFSDSDLNESGKNLRSKSGASVDFYSSNTGAAAIVKSEMDAYISSQANEVFPNWESVASAGQGGQISDGSSTRYVNGNGLEFNQLYAKSLIGALMTDQVLNNYVGTSVLDEGNNRADNDAGVLLEGKNYTNMEHKWDEAYGYVYGASADPTNPNATIGEDDSFLNKYIGRVEDDPDFTGIAEEIFQAFLIGRAAIVAGDYDLRDLQASIIRNEISKIISIRAVHYLQAGKSAIESQSMGTAFHDLSEGLGFVYSLQFTRMSDVVEPYFSKSEVDVMLEDILGGTNGLWDVSSETLDAISTQIADEFDFTVEEAAN